MISKNLFLFLLFFLLSGCSGLPFVREGSNVVKTTNYGVIAFCPVQVWQTSLKITGPELQNTVNSALADSMVKAMKDDGFSAKALQAADFKGILGELHKLPTWDQGIIKVPRPYKVNNETNLGNQREIFSANDVDAVLLIHGLCPLEPNKYLSSLDKDAVSKAFYGPASPQLVGSSSIITVQLFGVSPDGKVLYGSSNQQFATYGGAIGALSKDSANLVAEDKRIVVMKSLWNDYLSAARSK